MITIGMAPVKLMSANEAKEIDVSGRSRKIEKAVADADPPALGQMAVEESRDQGKAIAIEGSRESAKVMVADASRAEGKAAPKTT